MNKKFKSLEIVFENTDSIEIPAEYVLDANLCHITQWVNLYGNTIENRYLADDVLLQFKAEPLKQIYGSFDNYSAYYRIGLDDITSLIFHTEDGHETEIYVDWPEDNEDGENPYQTTKAMQSFIDDFESIFITVGKNIKFPYWLGDEDDE